MLEFGVFVTEIVVEAVVTVIVEAILKEVIDNVLTKQYLRQNTSLQKILPKEKFVTR
jgi:hypothetical protein